MTTMMTTTTTTIPLRYLQGSRLLIRARALSTTPPSSSTDQKSPPQPQGSNTLIVLSALGALGGLYYYYTRGQPAVDRDNVRRKEAELERRVKELGEAGKNKVESVAKRDYDQAKAKVTETGTDVAERAQATLGELENKFEEHNGRGWFGWKSSK